MPAHEYYEELCALLPIGELSAEEHQELSAHLRECANCRHATDDFSVILDEMPVEEEDVDDKDLTALQGASYRERFIQRAVAEGVPFSAEVRNAPSKSKKWSLSWIRPLLVPSLATAAIAVLVFTSAQVLRRWQEPLAQSNAELSQSPPKPVVAHDEIGSNQLMSQLEAKISVLEAQSADQEKVIADLKSRLGSARGEADDSKSNLAMATEHLSQLQKQASEANGMLAAAKADLERTRTDKDSLAANLVSQQFKINELVSEVKEKEAVAEREKQLSTVAKDVRELMGARNLHILDVSDVDGSGRPKKSFGRVFLVEGKSLIFYAFDLGDRGNPSKVSFQAWGQQEGRQAQAKNLGVFYIDDHAQKRWVLKVDDPQKLSAINSVFVTVEPLGGADRPSGKKLLYAFFGTQANHP